MEIGKLEYPSLKGTKLSEGICLNRKIETEKKEQCENTIQKQPKYDILELKETEEDKIPLYSGNLTVKSPPEFRKIGKETLDSLNNRIHNAIETANRKNMSYGERMKYLKDIHTAWVTDKRENDEEMFAFYLKGLKDDIAEGKSELHGLPSDFTMEDYHYYVDKWDKIWEQQRNEWKAFFETGV